MSKEGDKANVFRTTKVRTKLKGDGSWLQPRAVTEAETGEEKPWLAEVRAGRVNGVPIETSPATSPTKPTPPPTNSDTQKPTSGFMIRGIFTKLDKPDSPTNAPATNGLSGKTQFTKKPSESYKKLAPYTVKPTLESQENQLSPEDQEKRTEAASNVLSKSAGRQRSYVLSAAKKFESKAETPEALPDNSSLAFVAKRVEITDDEESAVTPAPAIPPPSNPVAPITAAASAPLPIPQKPVGFSVKKDVDVTVNKPAAPKVEVKATIPEPTKEEPAPVPVPEKDPFEGMKPGCTKVATPLPVLLPEYVKAVRTEPEPEGLSGLVETPLVDLAPASTTPASPPPASPALAPVVPLSPTPVSPVKAPAVPLSPTPLSPVSAPVVPLRPTQASRTQAPALPKSPRPLLFPTPAPVVPLSPTPLSPVPAPVVPLTPTLASSTPAPALPKSPSPLSPTPAPVVPLSPTPLSPVPAPVVPLSPTLASSTPAPALPKSPSPLSPTPAPVVPLSPTPLSPVPAPVVPLSPTLASLTPAPALPKYPLPLSPTPVVPLSPTPASPTPAPALPKSPRPTFTPLSPVPISPALVSAVSAITVKTEPEPEPEQELEPSPKPSSSADTLSALSDTLISFNTTSTSLMDDEPELALKEGGSMGSDAAEDREPTPEISDCTAITEDLLPLTDGPEASAEPVPPSPGRWSQDLLSGLDSKSTTTKTSTLGFLDNDVIVRNVGIRSLSMQPEEEKPTDETAKETQSSTETVTVTTKTVIITDKSEEDNVDPWRSRVKTTTTTESSSADPFDPYPIGTTSHNRSSDLLQPLADISISRASTTDIEKKDLSPDPSMSSSALGSLADDVIPINTEASSISTRRSWTRTWDSSTSRQSYTEESQDTKPKVQGEDQNTMVMFERKSKENDSPWDRWTSPTVYAIPGQEEEKEEGESTEDTQTQTVTTITTFREIHSEPEPVMDRYDTYTRTVVEDQRVQTPEPDPKKSFVYLKEYVNATELSLHNARDTADGGSDYLTSSSANYSYSSPSNGLLSSTCNYCGKPVGNDAKISIEHLNINCHPSCFKCGNCGRPMGDLLDSMFLHGGNVNCESCYSRAFD
ncbi:zinc finger protein 185 [Notolabrus celidotus]|uniref:zinc finger protein 185 n=1 Tax=Notolabrus celidotus TaxID=1203425 RepID=UPI00148F8107|nr:zinc finger protein 185 [Notolabrus celidotus]